MKTLRRLSIRALVTVGLAFLALAGAAVVVQSPDPSQGLHLGYENGQVVVQSVDYGSIAQRSGLRPGQVVVLLDGADVPNHDVFDLPAEAKRAAAGSVGPFWGVLTVNRDQIACDGTGRCSLPPEYPPDTFEGGPPGGPQTWVCLVAAPTASPTSSDAGNPGGVCQLLSLQLSADSASSGGSLVGVCYYPAPIPSPTSSGAETSQIVCFEGPLDLSAEPGPVVLTPRLEFVGSVPEVSMSGLGYGGPSEAWHDILFAGRPYSLKFPIAVGLAILLLGWLAIGRGWLGSTLRPYALTLPVATAVPLIGIAIDSYATAPATAFLALLLPLAMLPLAIDFLARVEGPGRRRLVALVTIALALASAAAGLLLPMEPGLRIWRSALVGGVAFVPGLFAARPFGRPEPVSGHGPAWWRSGLARALARVPGRFASRLADRLESDSAAGSGRSPRAFVESFDVLLAALTPGMAAVSLAYVSTIEVWPILLWLAVLLIATRQVLRPLARLATSATRQRDLVVAAAEAERARIAADIHDDALQDLSMLVRKLDEAGDTANAQVGREIAERLRVICGDLRLPILDDLGVGPALEWLCARFDQSAGSIVLDRLADEKRLPPDVELAFFRVAQEAIANGARHGAPPILVRYRGGGTWAELEVDDSGSGLGAGAARRAELSGHLGLLNMTQRAEAIGAQLTMGRRPGGGTRVGLVWESTAVAEAGETAPGGGVPATLELKPGSSEKLA